MKVKDILKNKGRDVASIRSSAGLVEAMNKMTEHKIGSLMVIDQGRVMGIITRAGPAALLPNSRPNRGQEGRGIHDRLRRPDYGHANR